MASFVRPGGQLSTFGLFSRSIFLRLKIASDNFSFSGIFFIPILFFGNIFYPDSFFREYFLSRLDDSLLEDQLGIAYDPALSPYPNLMVG